MFLRKTEKQISEGIEKSLMRTDLSKNIPKTAKALRKPLLLIIINVFV